MPIDKTVKNETIEVIPRGKYFGPARIRTQISCVTVDHSTMWLKINPTARLLGMALSLHSSLFYFLRAWHQPQQSIARYSPQSQLRRYRITAATSEVIQRGKYFGSARIRTQKSCVIVNHSNHVAKELNQQRGC